ncbi:MAG: hypothetical protein H6667_22140 [Ardenticatenaceae bacterium]|nr:hypothetical protein [Ardenticatenaceae bacterium]
MILPSVAAETVIAVSSVCRSTWKNDGSTLPGGYLEPGEDPSLPPSEIKEETVVKLLRVIESTSPVDGNVAQAQPLCIWPVAHQTLNETPMI